MNVEMMNWFCRHHIAQYNKGDNLCYLSLNSKERKDEVTGEQHKIAIFDKNSLSQKELIQQLTLCENIQCEIANELKEIANIEADMIVINVHDQRDLSDMNVLVNDGQSILALIGEMDLEEVLNKGIDIIKKPLRYAQLIAHIRFYFEQQIRYDFQPFQLGIYLCVPALKELITNNNIHIKLTEKETDILCYLYSAKGQVVSREILLSEVWGYNANVTTHTLETHMYRLRKKIDQDTTSDNYIMTEAGGYKLNLM
jgi:DNA-binding response OmpR family regulator